MWRGLRANAASRIEREPLMGLVIAYLICLVIGQSITIAVGLAIDRFYSPAISLPVSIALYLLGKQ